MKIKEIISTLETDIIPRLQSFSNCQSVTIGYDSAYFTREDQEEIIRICFDMPQQ